MNSLLVQKIESIKKQYHEMGTLKLCEAFLRFLLCAVTWVYFIAFLWIAAFFWPKFLYTYLCFGL